MDRAPPNLKGMARRSTTPLADQLPVLLEEHGLSGNQLAKMVGVNQSHISRILREADKKTVTGPLAARIADVLGLPEDWFPETRQARLFERLRGDQAMSDRLYDQLFAGKRPRGS
jgi:transcriptional regulator with XRE-family HTH domain